MQGQEGIPRDRGAGQEGNPRWEQREPSDPVEQSGLGGWNPESGPGVPAPFLWRWARPREVSSPLVRDASGGLLLAASLLASSPRRLSEPQACRAQGAASHAPRAGQ